MLRQIQHQTILSDLQDTLTEYSVSNNNNNNNRLSRSEDGIFKMKIDGSPSTTWLGPCFPIYIDRILQGDVYSIAFDYMIKSSVEVDKGLAFALKPFKQYCHICSRFCLTKIHRKIGGFEQNSISLPIVILSLTKQVISHSTSMLSITESFGYGIQF